MSLPAELAALQKEIEGYARGYGLDFFETVFEVVDYKRMNEVASYGGFATRYPHWTFGMEYDGLSKGYSYGLQKIYELVINNRPTYAYLLESNGLVDQKMVMAHVFGHGDFFKNNVWFDKTNRNMLDVMANHGTRVRRYIEKHGLDNVENFLDRCLSLENLIDHHQPFIPKRSAPARTGDARLANRRAEDDDEPLTVKKLRSKSYMDSFINPAEYLERQRQKMEEDRRKTKNIPAEPQKDVLLFLAEHAPLERWERDVLTMARDEAIYFAPQRQTKIMNEGWASYWHSKIMTTKALRDSELIDFADHHAATMGTRPGSLNPYKLGIELFRDIEDRWNRGRFGKAYDDCDSLEEKRSWDKALGLGREKIFEVRKLYSDITFIDEFLTPEFVRAQKLFTYAWNKQSSQYEIADREFRKVKEKLLQQLTNLGQPFVYVVDANHNNRGELYLFHRHDGVDLDVDHARETLKNVQALWRRPVLIESRINDRPRLLVYDGQDHKEIALDRSNEIRV
ncbi:MAG: SpoVR family protein [Acidobacteriota bacterium]